MRISFRKLCHGLYSRYEDYSSYQLGQVHVPENPHDNSAFRLPRPGTFLGPQCPQYRQNVPQTKVIVNLGGKSHAHTTHRVNVKTQIHIYNTENLSMGIMPAHKNIFPRSLKIRNLTRPC